MKKWLWCGDYLNFQKKTSPNKINKTLDVPTKLIDKL